MMRLPGCIRLWLFRRKIMARLPKYHTETGRPIRWDVQVIQYRNVGGYDPQTGEPVRRILIPRPKATCHTIMKDMESSHHIQWHKIVGQWKSSIIGG